MTKPTMTSLPLAISGLDIEHVADIQISLLETEKSEHFKFSYSKMLGYVLDYNTNEISSTNKVKFEHPAYETLAVELDRLWKNKRVYLGKKGSKYVRRGQLDMPFLPQLNKIGGLLNDADDLEELKQQLKQENLSVELLEGSDNVVLISSTKELDTKQAVWLAKNEMIASCGPIVDISTERFGFLTNHFDIEFESSAKPEEIEEVYKNFKLKQNFSYNFAPQLLNVSGPEDSILKVVEFTNSIRNHKAVKSIEIQVYEKIGQRGNSNRGIGNR